MMPSMRDGLAMGTKYVPNQPHAPTTYHNKMIDPLFHHLVSLI
jgi:hypothetical protein